MVATPNILVSVGSMFVAQAHAELIISSNACEVNKLRKVTHTSSLKNLNTNELVNIIVALARGGVQFFDDDIYVPLLLFGVLLHGYQVCEAGSLCV